MNSAFWHWRQNQAPANVPHIDMKNISPSRAARNKKRKSAWDSRQEIRLQLRQLFGSAFNDRERCEKVSVVKSVTLDVERGEVLSAPRYRRSFEV
jgi:ABC-type glutathione transport system ATPase component